MCQARILELEVIVKERDKLIQSKEENIRDKDSIIAEKNNTIRAKVERIAEQEQALEKLKGKMKERGAALEEKGKEVEELERAAEEKASMLRKRESEVAGLKANVAKVSWADYMLKRSVHGSACRDGPTLLHAPDQAFSSAVFLEECIVTSLRTWFAWIRWI